jgi:3-oxoadipate enol-lactonase
MSESRLNFSSQGDGRSVVLLHGFPFDSRVWSEQMAALPSVAHVVALDLPGFGKSPAVPATIEPSMDEYAKSIASTAGNLRLGKIVLVGHSMSGYIALAFARRYPEMLAGLVLVTTKPAADSKKAREGRKSLAAKVREIGAAATVSAMGAKLVAAATNERDPRILDRAKEIMLDQSIEGIVAALSAMARRPSSTSSLGNIRVPTLVIRGEEDALMPTRSVNSLARGIPGARLEVMRGAGHLPMMETPDQFNTALQSFLTKIQP